MRQLLEIGGDGGEGGGRARSVPVSALKGLKSQAHARSTAKTHKYIYYKLYAICGQ